MSLENNFGFNKEKLDTTRFSNTFVSYKNVIIAVPYVGKGARLFSIGNKTVDKLTKTDLFNVGKPVYMPNLGGIYSLTFRLKHRPGKEEYDDQDVIVGIAAGQRGIVLQLELPTFLGGIHKNSVSSHHPLAVDFPPKEILPVYNKTDKNGEDLYQNAGDPRSLIIVGNYGCRLVERWGWGTKDILPKEGRWKRNYQPDGIEINLKSGRIYTTANNRTKHVDLTDSLHKEGVDLEKTLEKLEDFGRWKLSDGCTD